MHSQLAGEILQFFFTKRDYDWCFRTRHTCSDYYPGFIQKAETREDVKSKKRLLIFWCEQPGSSQTWQITAPLPLVWTQFKFTHELRPLHKPTEANHMTTISPNYVSGCTNATLGQLNHLDMTCHLFSTSTGWIGFRGNRDGDKLKCCCHGRVPCCYQNADRDIKCENAYS